VAFAIIEPSGCGIVKDVAKLRVDCFLNEDDPHFDKCYVYVPVIPPEGYQGKVDKEGNPKNQADYDAWIESLPHIWQNNPFHSHKIWLPDAGASDNYINEQIERTLNYFYQFHQQSWDTGVPFIENWKKVPKVKGSIRDVFVKGDPKDHVFNEQKVADVLSRVQEFQISGRVPPTDLNIGEKGTIDVGIIPFNGNSYANLLPTTYVGAVNPANADGTIDTVQIWMYLVSSPIDVWIGAFSADGAPGASRTLTCRDSESIGDIPSGEQSPYTGLSIDIVTNDYFGTHCKSGSLARLERNTAGGSGNWYYTGDYIDASDSQAFGWSDNYELSLYGTGTESGGGGTLYGQSTIACVGDMTILGRKDARGEALMATSCEMTAVGRKQTLGAVVMATAATLTAVGRKALRGTSTIACTAGLTAVGKKVLRGTATIACAAEMTAIGNIISALNTYYGAAVALHGRSLITNLHNRSLSVKTRSKP